MIVNGMNEEELMKEIQLDSSNAYSRTTKEQTKFRRAVIKTKKFPVRTYIKYNSPRKNRWLIYIEAKNKKMVCGKSIVAHVALQNTDHGIYATTLVTTGNDNERFHFFTPHFFSRYAERCKIAKNGEDLIFHFLQNNACVYYQKTIDSNGNVTVNGACQDGIALGSMTEHSNYLFRTFITREFAIGSQIEDFKELDDKRLDVEKEFLGTIT